MSLFWLRFALVFYSVAVLYALVALVRHGERMSRFTMPAVFLGGIFHFVSIVEGITTSGHLVPASLHQSESLLAFMLVVVTGIVYGVYKTTTPGLFVFPVVFVLSLAAAIGADPPQIESKLLRNWWLFSHIALIFTGYAALAFSFVASLLYIVQSRSLKSKVPSGWAEKLPPLQTIDDIGYRSLLVGFPFMTFGLIAGTVVARSAYGPEYFFDPKIVLSLLMWAVYMVLLFARWTVGWRGRRAAYLSTFAFIAALGAWAANYTSEFHRFLRP